MNQAGLDRARVLRELRGVIAFPVTPLTSAGSLDIERYRLLLDCLLEGGVHGVVPCGSVGEFAYLTSTERKKMLEVTVEHVGSEVPVIAHVSAISTDEAFLYAEHAASHGASAVVANQQAYFPLTEDEMFDHFAAITGAGVPLFVYNQPVAGSDMGPEFIQRLAALPMVVGIKEASGDPTRVIRIKALLPEDFLIFSGYETLGLVSVFFGGQGWTSTLVSIEARPLVQLFELADKGDWDGAREAYRALEPLAHFLHSHPIAAVMKAALEIKGESAGPLRRPLAPLPNAAVDELRSLLEERNGPWGEQ